MTRYAIWAVPEGTTTATFKETIDEYAKKLQTPKFNPHMTVVSGIDGYTAKEAGAKMTEVKAAVKGPLPVRVQQVTYKDIYWQCVFALLEQTSPLTAINEKAKQVYNLPAQPPFMPHMSLIYSDMPVNERKKICDVLSPKFSGMKVNLTKLQLWTMDGAVEEWEMVHEIQL